MRLYVNIDHVATLREARKTDEPDPVQAAAASSDARAGEATGDDDRGWTGTPEGRPGAYGRDRAASGRRNSGESVHRSVIENDRRRAAARRSGDRVTYWALRAYLASRRRRTEGIATRRHARDGDRARRPRRSRSYLSKCSARRRDSRDRGAQYRAFDRE